VWWFGDDPMRLARRPRSGRSKGDDRIDASVRTSQALTGTEAPPYPARAVAPDRPARRRSDHAVDAQRYAP
jgi:hypothetical protein